MNAINDIAVYLLQTFLSLYLVAVLLRFLLQVARADFYNPICQFLVKITNPLLLPLRRLIPGFAGLDVAALLLAVALQMAAIAVLMLLNGLSPPNIITLFIWGVLGVIGLLVNIYFFALLGSIIISWVAPGSAHPAINLLHQITEPILAPVRRVMPAMGGLDFSPILVFILINVVQIALRHMTAAVGLHPALVIGI